MGLKGLQGISNPDPSPSVRRSGRGKEGGQVMLAPGPRSPSTYRLAYARGSLARYAIALAKLYQIRKFVIASFGSSKENKTTLETVNQCHPSHKK